MQPTELPFCREHAGRLRKGFEFSASAVTVTIAAAPKAADAPQGVVLASLRPPSGPTQLLCRSEFAATLAAATRREQR